MEWILSHPVWQLVLNKKNHRPREIHLADRIFFWLLRAIAWVVVMMMVAIVAFLFKGSLPIFHAQGWKIFYSTAWNPGFKQFGLLSFAYGTVISSLLALLIAGPLSIGAGIFLTELAPKSVARVCSFLIDMLAAIPSVVYGLWGIFVLAPWLRNGLEPILGKYGDWLPLFQGPPYGVGMLAAAVILAIMITPTIAAVSREVFQTVPVSIKEAALGLGATRWEMLRLAVLRTSWSGIFGACILGLGRAMGETMAVTMVIGNRAQISASLFAPAQSMASVIANEYGEAASRLHVSALAAVGLALFFVSLVINAFARLIIWQVERRGRAPAV